MPITAVELTVFEPEWDDPYSPRQRQYLAVEVRTEDGMVGISRGWGRQVSVLRTLLIPRLIGMDPKRPEEIWSALYGLTPQHLGREPEIVAAIGVLDIAVWDLFGKLSGIPCWQLFGGARDTVAAYADIPIRGRTPQLLAAELAAVVAAGFDRVKFHIVDPDPDSIAEQVRAARQAIGPGVELMVDVFRALDPATAALAAQRIEPYDVYWLEEPVHWHDQALGLARVASRTTIPIAGGETEQTLFGGRAILERGGVDVLQPDIINAGGYTNLRKLAAIAEAHHVRFAPHGANFPELAAPIVAGVTNGDSVPATTPGLPPDVWSRLYENFAIQRGRIQMSDEPGLGLTFDGAFLDKYRVASD